MMANLGSQLDTLSRRGIAARELEYEQVCVNILLTADWYRKPSLLEAAPSLGRCAWTV